MSSLLEFFHSYLHMHMQESCNNACNSACNLLSEFEHCYQGCLLFEVNLGMH